MPRPSLKSQRTEEILDAFQRCIVKDGIQGASLERIAEEAGMGRTILRHYVGNRDDLIVALAERYVAHVLKTLDAFENALPKNDRVRAMVRMMFSNVTGFDHDENLVADALIIEANRLPEVNELMTMWFDRFVHMIETELQREHPNAKPAARRAAAVGIVSTFLLAGSMRPIFDSPDYRRSAKRAAEQLVDALAE